MLKKTISYTDFNDQARTEEFYFNLTKAEIAEMQLVAEGDLVESLKAIVASNNGKQIIETFKDIVARAYGIKSEDGKHFKKSAQISEDFENSAAYSEFFMELVTNGEFAAQFINAVVPPDLAQTAQQTMTARERSEAQMQGFQKPTVKEEPKDYGIAQEADVSTIVLDSAQPVMAPEPEQLVQGQVVSSFTEEEKARIAREAVAKHLANPGNLQSGLQ